MELELSIISLISSLIFFILCKISSRRSNNNKINSVISTAKRPISENISNILNFLSKQEVIRNSYGLRHTNKCMQVLYVRLSGETLTVHQSGFTVLIILTSFFPVYILYLKNHSILVFSQNYHKDF
jgi:hypothetical protein